MTDLLTIDDRTIRARKFASQIIAIIGDCVSDKDGAMSRLIDAAYQADVEIAPTMVRDALRAVVRDINAYEFMNNLAPNPGRAECWDSVALAKAILGDVGGPAHG